MKIFLKCVLNPCRTCGRNVEQLIDELFNPLKSMTCPSNWNDFYKCPNLESLEPFSSDITDIALSPIVPLVDILNRLAPIDPCISAREIADNCATRLFIFGDREQKFASTVAQLEQSSCPLLSSSIECMTDFGNECLKNNTVFMYKILDSLISGAKQQYSSRCVDSGRYNALKLSDCLNQVSIRGVY